MRALTNPQAGAGFTSRLLKDAEARRNPRARVRENVIENSERNTNTDSSEANKRTLRPFDYAQGRFLNSL
jgi:hypothetical protein